MAEHRDTVHLSNEYARAYNRVLMKHGVDLPMPLLGKLIELFADALTTGAAIERAKDREATHG